MLTRPGRARPGITLLEVLTAIFIMGIGMLALLTLFPLGALSMARAIRDDRAAHIAANAAAVAVAFDLRNDDNINKNSKGFSDPNFQIKDSTQPGNPVFVDPYYVKLGARPLGEWPVGSGASAKGIKREAPFYVYSGPNINNALLARWFMFQDEIEFDPLGGAKGWQAKTVNRPGTYTHAYMVRRPRQDTRELVELTVVVYANRNTTTAEGEQTIFNGSGGPKAMGTQGVPTLKVDWNGQSRPDIRKGTWILDTTWDGGKQSLNGHFYRVETATDTGATQITLEVDRPLKADLNTIVVMQNVIAVLERGTTWRP
ncbi:MAG: prepilin-type N-terminal cleavage/methylation domain-containing protein [Gemmataceae bacterium]